MGGWVGGGRGHEGGERLTDSPPYPPTSPTRSNLQVGSIAAGGRYDNLVGMFSPSGTQVPCVGISIGIERIFAIMEHKARKAGVLRVDPVEVFVASIGADTLPERMKLARALWDAHISAEFSYSASGKVSKQLQRALESDVPFMVIVGESELEAGKVRIKDMRKHTEDLVDRARMVEELLHRGCGKQTRTADARDIFGFAEVSTDEVGEEEDGEKAAAAGAGGAEAKE